MVGSVRGEWDLTARPGNGDWSGTPQTVHLAFAQEFLPGVQDAWRGGLGRRRRGHRLPTVPARLLGQATAQVHGILADALGTTPTTHDTGSAIVDEMRGRFEAAVAEVDELARFAPAGGPDPRGGSGRGVATDAAHPR